MYFVVIFITKIMFL